MTVTAFLSTKILFHISSLEFLFVFIYSATSSPHFHFHLVFLVRCLLCYPLYTFIFEDFNKSEIAAEDLLEGLQHGLL